MTEARHSHLSANGISKRFGALTVLSDVSVEIPSGEALGIVGPNGAGKTTLMNALSGAFPPSRGEIFFDGQDITRTTAADRCHVGLVRTHQVPKPFLGMTVFENVFVGAAFGQSQNREEAYEFSVRALDQAGMTALANRPAETLGLLDRKRLELARALATQPRLLLLDEIGGGLTDAETDDLVAVIKDLNANGVGIVWIEHIVHVLLQVATRLICMDAGKILADGTPDAVLSHPEVVEAYMGGGVE